MEPNPWMDGYNPWMNRAKIFQSHYISELNRTLKRENLAVKIDANIIRFEKGPYVSKNDYINIRLLEREDANRIGGLFPLNESSRVVLSNSDDLINDNGELTKSLKNFFELRNYIVENS